MWPHLKVDTGMLQSMDRIIVTANMDSNFSTGVNTVINFLIRI